MICCDTFESLLASVQVDQIFQEVGKAGLGYKYKNVLPVSMLALVDDLIGITDAGCKAQQMKASINVKSAEKRLQFGISKCKSILISKKPEFVQNSQLSVDNWVITHNEDMKTREIRFVETYEGKILIDKTEKQKYLGFHLSSSGDNMINTSWG